MDDATHAKEFTPAGQQVEALQLMSLWFKKIQERSKEIRPFFYLLGFAGTGKSSLIKHFIKELNLPFYDVKFAAFSGKAARVMTKLSGFQAQTIHSLIYRRIDDPDTIAANGGMRWALNYENSELLGRKLLVLDEWSQINDEMFKDLLSFKVPIILLGDNFQLPPVSGPDLINQIPHDFFLTEIHRQALDNPIIRLSMMLRQGQDIPNGSYGNQVWKGSQSVIPPETWNSADIILSFMNKTRKRMNAQFRQAKGITSPYPVAGERLICLKNQKDTGLLNGLFCTVETDAKDYDFDSISLDLQHEDDYLLKDCRIARQHFIDMVDSKSGKPYKTPEWKMKFVAEFDYSQVITVHKAQGSQFDQGIIIDECFNEMRYRWLYTGLTRFSNKVMIASTV